jgi:hypothetical protein
MILTNDVMPSRTVIGYGNRRFSLFTNELIPFLMACDKLGLPSIEEVTKKLDEVAVVVAGSAQDEATKETYTKLLTEISLLLRGLIYEGV